MHALRRHKYFLLVVVAGCKMRIAAAVEVAQYVTRQINAELAAVLRPTITIERGKKRVKSTKPRAKP